MTSFEALLSCSPLTFLEKLRESGQHLVEVAHYAIVRELEYRRLLVVVYRDDHLRILDPGDVLQLARYPHGDVELRMNVGAREPDLLLLPQPPEVGGERAGPPQCSSERLREVRREEEVVLLGEP